MFGTLTQDDAHEFEEEITSPHDDGSLMAIQATLDML